MQVANTNYANNN